MAHELTMQVNLDTRTCPLIRDAVRDWFTGCFEMLGGELRERVLVAAPFPQSAVTTRKPEEPYGAPGDPWAHFVVGKATRGGAVRRRATAFSLESYEKFLQEAGDLPESAKFYIVALNEWGYLDGLPYLSINLARSTKDPDWLFLVAEFPRSLLADTAAESRVIPWLRTFTDTYAPSFGSIDEVFGLYRTRHEDEHGLIPNKTVLTSREKLRGHGWLTICADQIGNGLGGQRALEDSKAFEVVVSLDHGGYWLQATPTLHSYGHAEAERVARVLDPILVAPPT